jgi:hypothetical protein
VLPLAISHLCDDREERDEEWWLCDLGCSCSLEESSQILILVSALPLLPPLLGFRRIWAIIPKVAILPTCEASCLSLCFCVNVKEKTLDL